MITRFIQLQFGLMLFGIGFALVIKAGLGADPWTVFHVGLANYLGISVVLEGLGSGGPEFIAKNRTSLCGRVQPSLYEGPPLPTGLYVISFALKEYFAQLETTTLYPLVTVHFELRNPHEHFHLPLLISPGGYSTYHSYRIQLI